MFCIVFSKCASYIEEGRRLENLTWRLWTRETFCVEPQKSSDTSVLPLLRSEGGEPPELSGSVESAASDQAERIEAHINRPKCPDYRPGVVRDDSSLSLSRSREKHITSSGLERMVTNIKEKKNLEPRESPSLTAVTPPAVANPQPSTPTPSPPSPTTESAKTPTYPTVKEPPQRSMGSCSTTAPESDAPEVAPSDTSVSSCGAAPSKSGLFKSPSVVRGFSPAQVSSSYRSQANLAPDTTATKTVVPKPSPLKKKGGMFTLGGSSGDDDESSFEDRMQMRAPRQSSLSDELVKPGIKVSAPSRKSSPVRSEAIREKIQEDEDAVVTDDESESAIDDEEESDWEDSVTESGLSSVQDNNNENNNKKNNSQLFQRVDSRPNLVSRRSLLTMMMHQPPKMQRQMQMNPTRSTSALQRPPNGPSVPDSPSDDEEEEESLTMRGPDIPRSKPIVVQQVPPQSAAHSPRTTRRNMLATELTESLRKHLLWERHQKSATANAYLKRRHTAHDVANLQEYPGAPGGQKTTANVAIPSASNQVKDKEYSKNGSWNNYTDFGPWEYHAKGW